MHEFKKMERNVSLHEFKKMERESYLRMNLKDGERNASLREFKKMGGRERVTPGREFKKF